MPVLHTTLMTAPRSFKICSLRKGCEKTAFIAGRYQHAAALASFDRDAIEGERHARQRVASRRRCPNIAERYYPPEGPAADMQGCAGELVVGLAKNRDS